MRDDSVRIMSRQGREAWLRKNTRFNPATEAFEMWNVITLDWQVVTPENLERVYPREVYGICFAEGMWQALRDQASQRPYNPIQQGDSPIYSEPQRQAWIRENRRRKCLPERIEIWDIILGRWVAVTVDTLAQHYSRSYWARIGLEKAWAEIQKGDIETIVPDDMTFDEHVAFLADHLFGPKKSAPIPPDERLSVVQDDFYSVQQALGSAGQPQPQPQCDIENENMLRVKISRDLEAWSVKQTGFVTSRLIVEDLLGGTWPLPVAQLRSLTQSMRDAGWTQARKSTVRFWIKDA